MAARTFTSAGVDNLWSNPLNWDGGLTIPAEDDSVTIPAGQTCEYDYNSAYTTGIAGITVTGTLKLTRTPGTYKLFIKAATTIGGAGTFDCGASALDPIPFASKHTITGGAGWYINGAAGLTMTVYAAEPAIKTILLSGDEAIGQTELSVATDITGDIWADGDTIRIDNINKAANSEERVIAAGGRASGALTITAGLTAAKIAGTVISLITRNVRFIGVGATGFVGQNFATGKLTIAGGQWTTANYRIFTGCASPIISGGTFSGSLMVLTSCTIPNISGGTFSGNDRVLYLCTSPFLSGCSVSGNSQISDNCSGLTINGGFYKGNSASIINSSGLFISGGTFSGNGNLIQACAGASIYGGTFSGNVSVMNLSSGIINNATLLNNTQDFNQSVIKAFNTLFGSATENILYSSLSNPAYSESFDHDQIAGAYKAWTKGGVTSSQAVTVPTGYTQAMQTVLENVAVEGYWQKEITVGAGASVNITSYLRKAASMTYLPRVIVFNKASADPFAGGAGLHTFTMTDSIDTWESDLYTYTNSTAADVTLVIRTQGMAASGSVYSLIDAEQINVDLTTALAQIAAIKAKTDPLTYTVANQIDANALTGGITGADIRTALGLATANLDTQLTGIPAAVWAVATSTLTGVGTIGKYVMDLIAGVWAYTGGRTLSGLGAYITLISTIVNPEIIQIVAGDDYSNSDGRALDWTLSGWPSLIGSTVKFYCGPLSITGTVVNATQARVDLTAAQTKQLEGLSRVRYKTVATLAGGSKITFARGQVEVF